MPTKAWIEVPIDQEIVSVPDTGYAPILFSEEVTKVVFEFNDTTFLQVLSALINGAALTYPDTFLQVVWYFLQNVEYPVAICEQIIDCITNDSDTRNALSDWLASDPAAQQTIQDMINKGSSVKGGGTSIVTATDDDALFGACTFLIDTMHDAITDFDQLAELGTNFRERADIILQAIPVFGDAIAAIPEYIDELFDNVIEVFDGQYTTTPITGSRDRLRCGIFCLAKLNDRVLTWDLIETYFWDLVSFESTIPNLALDFVGFLATGSWSGQDVVNISFANMATALSAGNKFGVQTFPNLGVIMQLGANNPDADWATVCTECIDCPTYALNTATWNSGDGAASGITVFNGTSYHVDTVGTYTYGGSGSVDADGHVMDHTPGTIDSTINDLRLIGKIGIGGAWFALGVSEDFTAESDGELYVIVNDVNASVNFADNVGTLTLTVCVAL